MLGILGHCPWQEPHKTVPWQRWLNTRGGEEGLCLPCWADPLLWKTSVSHSKSLNQALVNLSSHPPRTGQLFTVQLQYAFAQQFFFFFFLTSPFIKLSDLQKLQKSQATNHWPHWSICPQVYVLTSQPHRSKTQFVFPSTATNTTVAHRIKILLSSYLRGRKKQKKSSSHLADVSNALCCISNLCFAASLTAEWGIFSRLGPTSSYSDCPHPCMFLSGMENMGNFEITIILLRYNFRV